MAALYLKLSRPSYTTRWDTIVYPKEGAALIPSLAFVFSSTNLVVELGIVLWLPSRGLMRYGHSPHGVRCNTISAASGLTAPKTAACGMLPYENGFSSSDANIERKNG